MLINKSDYLDQYDKELKAEPYGKSKQEKIDALSEMTDVVYREAWQRLSLKSALMGRAKVL